MIVLFLAEASPTFGATQLRVLLFVLAGIALLMLAIRYAGLWLERGHPDPEISTQEAVPAPAASGEIEPEIIAVIAAATSAMISAPHRIVAVSQIKQPTVEGLMQQWSMEGRRQIYSSHQVR